MLSLLRKIIPTLRSKPVSDYFDPQPLAPIEVSQQDIWDPDRVLGRLPSDEQRVFLANTLDQYKRLGPHPEFAQISGRRISAQASSHLKQCVFCARTRTATLAR